MYKLKNNISQRNEVYRRRLTCPVIYRQNEIFLLPEMYLKLLNGVLQLYKVFSKPL